MSMLNRTFSRKLQTANRKLQTCASAASAVALAATAAFGATTLDNDAMRARKGALVLQIGSDWCVSGETVKDTFQSAAFKAKAGSQYVFGIYDDMDEPTDAARAKNELVRPLYVRSKRLPAITCYTPPPGLHVFAQIENVPQNVSPEKLAKAISKVSAAKDKAEALFRRAAAAKDKEAADLYGQGFDILCETMAVFKWGYNRDAFKALTTGDHGYRAEWDALVKLDAGDRFGWIQHFTMGTGVDIVQKVSDTLREGTASQAEAYLGRLLKIPQEPYSANQKQCMLMAQFALHKKDGFSAANKKLLKDAFALGRDTLWGQCAMGYLILSGEKIASKGLPKAAVRPRPNGNSGVKAPFLLENVKKNLTGIKADPKFKFNDAQKMAAVRFALLRAVGQEGWQNLVNKPGSGQFIKAFMNDRVWMEDFIWSGTVDDAAASLMALEALIFQDNGRWTPFEGGKYADNEGRRFMTALALVYPQNAANEEWLADVLDAYRATAFSGRLHKSAYSQPVWMWRFAVHQGHRTASCDNMAAQQRHMEKFINCPMREYGSTPWMIDYRLINCFGESVHGPHYYEPWALAGEWPKRKYSQMVGGVCGELSKFGSATANCHGLPSCTVGQPGHCAYTRRLLNGKWEINYNVTGHSQMHLPFWGQHEWQYVEAIERTYTGDRETRLDVERWLALASLAEDNKRDDKTIENFYRVACATQREHYGAWKQYGEWLARANPPLDKFREWVRGCARGMKTGRQPLWNILTPYFKRVAQEKGQKALADDLIAFAPYLRQSDTKIQEEASFSDALNKWTEQVGNDTQTRYDILKAVLTAQVGTADYFSQAMGWGGDFLSKAPGGSKLVEKCLNEAFAAKTKGGKGALAQGSVNFGPMILSASKSRNLEAFRNTVAMQKKLAPVQAGSGANYPLKDFGGELVSKDGLLQTSSTCGHDHPERYPLAIDESPCASQGAFHTDSEDAPWATVMLAGPTDVKGVVIENRFGGYNATRQVPLYVAVSEDGQNWLIVSQQTAQQDTYRIDLRSANASRIRFVRVGRKAGAKKEFFHLNKILVYGVKLY